MIDRAGNIQLELEHDLSAASHGRRAVRELLDGDAAAPLIRDAMLATSELVTNAVLHTSGTVGLWARYDQRHGWLRVEVSDSSRDAPHPRAVGAPDQIGGLGLRVVAAVASSWGSVTNEHGKTVWFELVESDGRPSPDDLA